MTQSSSSKNRNCRSFVGHRKSTCGPLANHMAFDSIRSGKWSEGNWGDLGYCHLVVRICDCYNHRGAVNIGEPEENEKNKEIFHAGRKIVSHHSRKHSSYNRIQTRNPIFFIHYHQRNNDDLPRMPYLFFGFDILICCIVLYLGILAGFWTKCLSIRHRTKWIHIYMTPRIGRRTSACLSLNRTKRMGLGVDARLSDCLSAYLPPWAVCFWIIHIILSLKRIQGVFARSVG